MIFTIYMPTEQPYDAAAMVWYTGNHYVRLASTRI